MFSALAVMYLFLGGSGAGAVVVLSSLEFCDAQRHQGQSRRAAVARAGLRGQSGIVAGTLIGVLNNRTDGRAGRLPVQQAGLDERRVGLLALGGLFIASGRTALHLAQDKGFIIWNACRKAIDYHADAGAV